MGGPPGSQVAQTSPNQPRSRRQRKGKKPVTDAAEGGALVSCNGRSGGAVECFRSSSSFQPPRQPNVYTDCVPLRELYSQVQRGEGTFHSICAKGGRSGGHRKQLAFTLQQSFRELPYPRGMVNSSNFCFMNSILQALVFIPPFAQLAVSISCDAQARQLCPTLAILGKWVLQYWKPGFTRLAMTAPTLMQRAPIGANSTTNGASRTATVAPSQRILDGSVQEDAQEFLQKLLERLHEELVGLEEALCNGEALEPATESPTKRMASGAAGSTADANSCADSSGDEASSVFNQKGWTIVKKRKKMAVREHEDAQGQSKLLASIFGGTLESHLQGKERQRDRVSVMIETYYCLPVDVGFAPECTIEQALERTFMTERIYDSDRQKNLKKTLRLGRLPSILFVQLRRWVVTREGELVKLENTVRIKRTLIIPRAICSDETLINAERTYRLLSVVCHRGDAVSRGHYVTYLLHHAASPAVLKVHAGDSSHMDAGIVPTPPDATTAILCNDASISLCPTSNVEKETLYFLVYQKIS
ncbi:hypothetical protein JKF63_02486 [Porcisia hertigi]|uniref:ubiquitinyl hydrolase 1 n=1 Tax=Porcisia hertigi TaxID=2761500 RepID=A0A836I435_9TRYP|nr:hypothetical protein JKF63_02486 [Porcisia hertigi]